MAGTAGLSSEAPASACVCVMHVPLCIDDASARWPQEHDAAELARLAQLLAECRLQLQQERQHVAPPEQAGGVDWMAAHRDLLHHLQAMSAAASQLLPGSGGEAEPAAQQAAWHALAASSAELQRQHHAAAAALPAQLEGLASQQRGVAEAAAAGPRPSGTASGAAQHHFAALLEQQRQAVACSLLAGHA